MVMKKRTGTREKKYKIAVKHMLGPYSDQKTAYATQAQIKKKVPKTSFSKIVKSKGGYRFSATTTYVRAFDASVAEVKRAIVNLVKKNSPGAVVSVQPV